MTAHDPKQEQKTVIPIQMDGDESPPAATAKPDQAEPPQVEPETATDDSAADAERANHEAARDAAPAGVEAPTSDEAPKTEVDAEVEPAADDAGVADEEAGEEEEKAEEPKKPAVPTYIQRLEQALQDKEDQLKSYIEAHRAAEKQFEASRQRLERELEQRIEREKSQLVTRFFEVLDNLERSLEAAGKSDNAGALREGVQLVHDQFLTTLGSFGLAKIDPRGETFDPAFHEAVAVIPTTEEEQDQRVQSVLRNGYRAGDNVLRPAMVVVGRFAG